jgi:peptidyl-dipeptidase Dcp
MVAAAFWSAERLYQLSFREVTGTVPVFHPDVRVFEVVGSKTGHHVGLFYLDNFARAGKKSGAWAVSYREQHRLGGVSPIVSNNNNFVKPGEGERALVSVDDVRTLFHEFGHALHALLQNVAYPTFAATPNDFVEFPSQLQEYWMLTRDVLDRFARHHETGAAIRQDMIDKVERSRHFNQGYATVEYLAAAILDMNLHTRQEAPADPARFEREELATIGMPREVALRHRLPQFDHLFGSDAYAAGYYSYMWAEVLAADAWQAFQDAGGPWDEATAHRLATSILSDGNSTDRAEAYRQALGHDPDVAALFVRRGLAG